MNRRNRKKKQTSLLDDLKGSASAVEPQKVAGLWGSLPSLHRRGLMVLVPLFLILLFVPFPDADEVSASSPTTERVAVSVDTTGLSQQRTEATQVVQTKAWREYTVKEGDTLAKVFRTNQLPMVDLNALVSIEGLDKPLSKIRQGQLVRFKLTAEGKLDILQLEKSGGSVMFFRLSDGGFGRSK